MPTLITPADITPGGVGGWQTVNKPAAVPASQAGLILLVGNASAGSVSVGARTPGVTDDIRSSMGVAQGTLMFAGLVSDQVQVYKEDSNTTFTCIGYFTPAEAVFPTTLLKDSVWSSIAYNAYTTIAAWTGADTAVAVMISNAGTVGDLWAVRKPGSTDDFYPATGPNQHHRICACDGSEQIEVKAQNGTPMPLVGYLKTAANLVWNTNAIDRTPVGNGAYETITAAAGLGLYHLNGTDATFVRKIGDTNDYYSNRNRTMILADTPQEAKDAAVSTTKIYELGYFSGAAPVPTYGMLVNVNKTVVN